MSLDAYEAERSARRARGDMEGFPERGETVTTLPPRTLSAKERALQALADFDRLTPEQFRAKYPKAKVIPSAEQQGEKLPTVGNFTQTDLEALARLVRDEHALQWSIYRAGGYEGEDSERLLDFLMRLEQKIWNTVYGLVRDEQ